MFLHKYFRVLSFLLIVSKKNKYFSFKMTCHKSRYQHVKSLQRIRQKRRGRQLRQEISTGELRV